MLKIQFQVNEEYLSRIMISKSYMPTEFANYLWDKYRDTYQMLKKDVVSTNIDIEIVKEVQKQDFFTKNFQDAKNNCSRIQSNWDKNKEKIQNFLKGIMKIDFDLEVTAYIFPSYFNLGMNIGNNCICWGHNRGLKEENYDLVYLVHEALHSYFERDDLCHAIIENISDVELSRLLNNTFEYYPYHSFTQNKHVKIYPYWNLYLNKSRECIISDQEYTKIKYNIDKFENERDVVTKLNIKEFVEFLREKTKLIEFVISYEIV